MLDQSAILPLRCLAWLVKSAARLAKVEPLLCQMQFAGLELPRRLISMATAPQCAFRWSTSHKCLETLLHGITLLDPIRRETCREDQDAYVGETQVVHSRVRGSDVRAAIEGAASAIDD